MNQDQHRAEIDARREEWEHRWSQVDPRLSPRPVPSQVRLACEQEWFAPGARLLDVGCGLADTASWLAQAGYCVTAIDFSYTAIERARHAHSGQSRLRFAEHDICSGPPANGPFSALLDWGCLQGVPEAGRKEYARNLAAVSAADARLLLFHRAGRPGEPVSLVIDPVEKLLARDFELVEAEECMSASPAGREWPGVALRFGRRRS